MKIIITIFLLVINCSLLISCSCAPWSFCDVMHEIEESVVFKGETVKLKSHGNHYHSAVIKVIKIFKGQEVLTDTIELFGGRNSASCEKLLRLNIGDINYFAILNSDYSPMDISQFEHESKTHWSKGVNLCGYKKLDINAKFVEGRITNDFSKYPFELFEEALEFCTFSIDELENHICPGLVVFPNPVSDYIYLRDIGNPKLIEELKIFSTTGKLLMSALHNDIFYRRVPLPYLEEKILILRMKCGEEWVSQKLLILKE